MLKSIKNLMMAHFREKGLKDVTYIVAFTMIIIIYYLLFYPEGLGAVRKESIWIWIISVTGYTLLNAFNGYGDLRKSYFKLLLPAPISAKFIWEWFRTLILFGGITLGLLFAFDALFEHMTLKYATYDTIKITSASSLKEILFAKNEPLNYLPVMAYIVILLHSVSLLVRTKMNKAIVALLFISTWVLINFLPLSDDRSLLYPFISQQNQWDILGIQLSWSPRNIEYLISYIWLSSLPIALYILSYFRIKESEL